MIEDKNIPDMGQSWLGAEKMLDRHFRNQKIFRIALSVAIPALIVGLALLFNNHKNEVAENSIDKKSLTEHVTPSTIASSTEATASYPGNAENTSIHSTNLNQSTPVSGPVASTSNSIPVNKNSGQFDSQSSRGGVDLISNSNSNTNSNSNPHSHSNSNSNTLSNTHSNTNTNTNSNSNPNSNSNSNSNSRSNTNSYKNSTPHSNSHSNLIPVVPSSSVPSSAESFPKSQSHSQSNNSTLIFSEDKSEKAVPANDQRSFAGPAGFPEFKSNSEPIAMLKSFDPQLFVSDIEYSSKENNWPRQLAKPCNRHVSWDLAFYVGAHYQNKTIEGSSDDQNFINRRKNEEDPITTPSLGISLTASIKTFSLSIGVEYATYGEKTKYYPYSNQNVITSTSGWQTFMTNYTDTDIWYITGNYYPQLKPMQRLDSAYITDYDTTQANLYNAEIAMHNGNTRISYLEIPIEASFCFTKGKAGFGLSGGISPAFQMGAKGYYIKRDGSGVESLSEIKSFNKVIFNARFSADFYYRFNSRMKFLLRPQIKSNLNSIFDNSYGAKQKYYSTGILFGVSYMIN